MPEESLTYRASGVDIRASRRAKERIKAHVRRTHGAQVVTRLGLFGGGVSLAQFKSCGCPLLVGSLADAGEGGRRSCGGESILDRCLEKIPGATGVAFLDYLAASLLSPARVEAWVKGFADGLLRAHRGSSGFTIPLVGGETAEMPGVFRPGGWEVVGALFGVAEGASSSQPGSGPPGGLSAIRGMDRPVLVASIDGVGTKTMLGAALRRTSGLALDMIHHSLNDILCLGARGLAVMFYVGCHRLEEELVLPLRRAAEACLEDLGLACLEFRLAEKPGLYLPGQMDICAAVAGLAEEGNLLQGSGIAAGNLLVGLPSNGLHTNGYSLARKALLERAGLGLEDFSAELGSTLGEALLAPHRNYAPLVLPLLGQGEGQGAGAVRGIAHITGGGLAENLSRILPQGTAAEIRTSAWQPPPIFGLIQRCGNIPASDLAGKGMFETFNMGIGMVLVVSCAGAQGVMSSLRAGGEEPRIIGRVVAGRDRVDRRRVRLLP